MTFNRVEMLGSFIIFIFIVSFSGCFGSPINAEIISKPDAEIFANENGFYPFLQIPYESPFEENIFQPAADLDVFSPEGDINRYYLPGQSGENFYNYEQIPFASPCFGSEEANDLIVNLPDGKIKGHILTSAIGQDFYAFQEIPYAAPPIGDNRLKESKEPQPWDNIRDATENVKVCMQNKATALTPVPDDMTQNEDCLFLNVYTPLKPGTPAELPVLFFIHGGGFFYGSGALQYYNPKYFMDYDIIVVTFNYRLGPLGFLTTEDNVIPGNLGLKDQLLALKWVVKNIHLFGGNPKKITVMGESAGSTSAGFMQLSKLSKDLVSGYVLESGSPLSPYAYQDRAKHYAFKLGHAIDPTFFSENSSALLKLLRSASAEDITTAAVANDGYVLNPIAATVVWLPVLENHKYPNAYISEPMQELLIMGEYNQVPMITGMTSEESVFFLRYLTPELEDQIKGGYDAFINLTVNPRLNIPTNLTVEAGTQYKKVYTTKSFKEDRAAFAKYLSDEVFTTPNLRHAELASHRSPVYVYEFAHKGPMGGFINLPEIPGADNVGHTEELHYLFGGYEGFSGDLNNSTKDDILIMRRMLTLWTNFVKYQNPTPVQDPLLDNVIWPTVECGQNITYLKISRNLQVQENPKYYSQVSQIFNKYIKPPYYVF